jgi:cation diffusion facilitator family transporter
VTGLARWAWLSIAAAVVTIALKTLAWRLTGSVGLLSDALESLVNLAAAVMTLAMLHVAARPPDAGHAFGHAKAEYFASATEGVLILVAAFGIAWTALERLLAPQAIEAPALGLAVSAVATAVNLGAGLALVRAGRRFRSIALEADGHHLLTDVWTSVGVVAGVGLVALTGWTRLDPIVALLVAVNIVVTGVKLVRRSALGLLDTAFPPEDQAVLHAVLERHVIAPLTVHAIRTRQAGPRRFVSMHVLVPGAWSVRDGHAFLEHLEADIRAALPQTTVDTHLEPLEEEVSFRDQGLDRD